MDNFDGYCVDIGQTGRSFKSRINGRFRYWKDIKSDSLFSNHILNINNTFNPEAYLKKLHRPIQENKL